MTRDMYYTNTKEEKQLRHFKVFNSSVVVAKSWIPYAVEWKIFSEDIGLAGTLDALFCRMDPHGNISYVLVDWKFCKEVKFENRWKKGRAYCTEELDDCNYNKYRL